MIPESVRCTSCEGGRVACGHDEGDYQMHIGPDPICFGPKLPCPDCKGSQINLAAVVRLVERDNIIRERMTSYGINPDWSPAGLLRHMDNNSGATIAIERQLRKERDEQVTALTTERDELREGRTKVLAYIERYRHVCSDIPMVETIEGILQRTNTHEEGSKG